LAKFAQTSKMKMEENNICPKCGSEFTYPDNDLMVCSQCFHEWNPKEAGNEEQVDSDKILDSNGNELQNGDTVMVIKDLPVKGAPKPVKAGTKVKNIRLSDGDHNISCKIDGFGAMGLKSEFVKKV
jgi:protein PhnA